MGCCKRHSRPPRGFGPRLSVECEVCGLPLPGPRACCHTSRSFLPLQVPPLWSPPQHKTRLQAKPVCKRGSVRSWVDVAAISAKSVKDMFGQELSGVPPGRGLSRPHEPGAVTGVQLCTIQMFTPLPGVGTWPRCATRCAPPAKYRFPPGEEHAGCESMINAGMPTLMGLCRAFMRPAVRC